jgi:hypothetical protein
MINDFRELLTEINIIAVKKGIVKIDQKTFANLPENAKMKSFDIIID